MSDCVYQDSQHQSDAPQDQRAMGELEQKFEESETRFETFELINITVELIFRSEMLLLIIIRWLYWIQAAMPR